MGSSPIGGTVWILLAPLARIALWNPPTSSSFGDEKHVPSLLLSTAARDPMSNLLAPLARIALWNPPTSSSFGDEKHVPSFLLSTAARDPMSNLLAPRLMTRSACRGLR
jgi:hypothetical protein